MSDDVIEHAHQLLQPKINYVRQLKTALDAEARLKQRVKDLQNDRSFATSDAVQAALDAAASSAQQALDAAKETTKQVRKEALTEGGWSRGDLAELGLIATRKRRKTQDTGGSGNDHESAPEPDNDTGPDTDVAAPHNPLG